MTNRRTDHGADQGADHRPAPGSADRVLARALLMDAGRTPYDRAPCGYLSTTPDGRIVNVNDTFLAWTGHAREALLGRARFSSLLTAGGRIYHDTHYAPMLRLGGEVREIALEVVKVSGERLPVLVSAVLERDEAGEPTLVRVVLFDATERRQYERELLREKHRAEASEARAQDLAQTLQRTLIPPAPPHIPGLDIAAAYRPAGRGEEVGGDFYDVFQIAEDDWVVAVGDVCGKGVDAAVLTALVRHTLRAVTVQQAGAAESLQALNDVLLRHGMDRFCTVVLLRLRRVGGGGWRVSASLGGHPRPLLVRQGSGATPFGIPGSLVGVLDSPVFEEEVLDLAAGTTLLLYTDGVTEGRRGDRQYGESRLAEVASGGSPAPEAIVERVLADVMDFQGGRPRDDIAVLALGSAAPA